MLIDSPIASANDACQRCSIGQGLLLLLFVGVVIGRQQTGNGTGQVRLPAHEGVAGQDAHPHGAVEKIDQQADGQAGEIFSEKTRKEQESGKTENQTTGTEMVGRAGEKPHRQAGEQPNEHQHLPGHPGIEIEHGREEHNEGGGIAEKVGEAAVEQGGEHDAGQPRNRAGMDAETIEIVQEGQQKLPHFQEPGKPDNVYGSLNGTHETIEVEERLGHKC